jgi:CheY-like chemotaxis protein
MVRTAVTKHYGWVVLEAVDGVDGVARFLMYRPDILITDVSMPQSDGLEMLSVLRKGGLLKDVRVIIMSGVLKVEEIPPTAGADALLGKPFNLQDLYHAIEGGV